MLSRRGFLFAARQNATRSDSPEPVFCYRDCRHRLRARSRPKMRHGFIGCDAAAVLNITKNASLVLDVTRTASLCRSSQKSALLWRSAQDVIRRTAKRRDMYESYACEKPDNTRLGWSLGSAKRRGVAVSHNQRPLFLRVIAVRRRALIKNLLSKLLKLHRFGLKHCQFFWIIGSAPRMEP
jgi:hypothetical protein